MKLFHEIYGISRTYGSIYQNAKWLDVEKKSYSRHIFIQNISLGETTYISSISTTWVLLESSNEFMFYSFLRKILFACISRVMLLGEENFYSLIISFLP